MPKKRDKVLRIEEDGQYITAQFQISTGEWVVADFKLIGWRRCPAAIGAEFDKVINAPPLVTYGRRPGARQAAGR
jgi:hypothetical protein